MSSGKSQFNASIYGEFLFPQRGGVRSVESQRPPVEAQVSAAGVSCRVGDPRASPSPQYEPSYVSGVSEFKKKKKKNTR